MRLGLKHNQIKVLFHSNKEHGLTEEVMKQINDDCEMLWVPDAGSNDVEQMKQLSERGIKILCTDHHNLDTSNPYCVLVNNQISEVNKDLSGAGVTYKLCKRYDELYNTNYSDDLIDLVAVSIVGDVMNLSSLENRTFLYYGFRHIVNPFIKAVLTETTPEFISFSVAPLINAVVRSDNQELKENIFWAMVGLKEPDDIIKQCKSAQRKQQTIVKKYTEEMTTDLNVEDKVLVVVSDINSSYTGLVASKISGMYNKPVLILHEKDDDKDILLGSVRSPVAFKDVLNNSGLCIYATGHNEACGASLYKQNLDSLKQYFAQLTLDTEVIYDVAYSMNVKSLTDMMFTMCDDCNELFGQGLPKPQFHIKGIRINSNDICLIGNNKTTVKWNFDGVDYLKFFCGADVREKFMIGEGKDLDIEIIGTLGINEWCGKIANQIIIDKFEVKEAVKTKGDWKNIF